MDRGWKGLEVVLIGKFEKSVGGAGRQVGRQ